MMAYVPVDYVAVLVAAVVGMVIGYAWYSPFLFGNAWMKEAGYDKKSAKKGGMGPMTLIGGYVAAAVMAYVLAHLLFYSNAVTITDALMGAFWIWLGTIAVVFFNGMLYEGKSITAFGIHAGYYLVSLAAMGVVLVSM